MQRPLLILVAPRSSRDEAVALAEAVLDGWPDHLRPDLKSLDPDALSDMPTDAHPIGAVWYYTADTHPDESLFATIQTVQDWAVPAMLSRVDDPAPPGSVYGQNILIAPPHLGAPTLRAMLQALISQAPLADRLRGELTVTLRHHGGLRGQINQLDEELRLAARIQRDFLPDKLPAVGPVQPHVLYRPAGYVSGDVYNVMRLEDHLIGLYIADAVGHGVPAAMMTMFIQHALPTRVEFGSTHRTLEPAESLAALNRALLDRQTNQSRFTTACYAVINTQTLQMRVARAGHPAPLLMRADGSIQAIEPDGALLGVFDNDDFDQESVQLDPGDRFLMFSDGFELAFGDAHDVKQPRYMHELRQLRNGDPAKAIAQLDRRMADSAGSLHQRDDVTAILTAITTDKPDPDATSTPAVIAATPSS